ncbi:hypothetical protein [Nonomuraea sp. NPDC049400]|uniref:hypothetical protein n=1 Tax=Nonomuraea sp. NPDC049400 TaxID=3364352 RepID=UPI00379A1672
MTGLLDGAASLLDRRQLTSVWVPLVVFLAGLAAVVAAGVGWGESLAWWNGLATETRVLLVLAVVLVTVVAGHLLSAARAGLVRCYEGYWPGWRVLRPLRTRLLARHLTAQRARAPGDPELFLTYPRSAGRTLPTRLGNILRAAEEHGDRYGLDTVSAWPRLYSVLPDAFRASFAQAAAALETAVTVSFLSAVFAVVGGLAGVLLLPGPGAAVCVWGGALLAVLGYRGAVRAARPYGQLVRAAFDVHRFLLLEAMRLRLPNGPGQELAQWHQLGKLWYQGAADFDQVHALRYPAEGTPPEPVKKAPAKVAAAPAEAGPEPRRSRIRAALTVAVLAIGGLAWVAAAALPPLGPSDAGVVAASDLPAFQVLASGSLRQVEGPTKVADLVGRYTLRPLARQAPVRPADLGPRVGGALAGRAVTTVTIDAGADRIRRGQMVGVRTSTAAFDGLIVLDVHVPTQKLIVAVPADDLDTFAQEVTPAPARLVLPLRLAGN